MQQRYAVVTGGSRGIGLEVCRKLVAQRKPVILTARRMEAAEAAAETLRQEGPGVDVQPYALEASDPASIRQLTDALRERFDKRIDLLVNSAGILVRGAWDEQTYDQTLAVNVTGPLCITEQLLPALPHGALVIQVSSGNGMSPCLTPDYLAAVRGITSLEELHDKLPPFDADSPMGRQPADQPGAMAPTYSVSKALLNRMVQLQATPGSPLQQRGVSVCAISPGWCRTEMGTDKAERSAAKGAESLLWPWEHWQPGLNGSFTRDGIALDW